jgi:hypothetical protein
MSVLVGSSVFKRDVPAKAEYSLYAKVSDISEYSENVQPLTDNHLIQHSDCVYQRIWNKIVQPHFKAGLLLCRDGDNIERDDMNRQDKIGYRSMFLILCETGVRHYEGRGPTWVEREEDMTPGNYIYLRWNFDHLFTTADGKSIQLKVVDARPVAAQQRSAITWLEPGGAAESQLAQMKILLQQMKLSK